MSVKSVSSRYAKSLLELAQEQDQLETIYQDILTIQELLKNRELFAVIKSPVIPSDKKIKVMDALLRGKVDDLTLRWVRLIIKKERSEYLLYIAQAFIEQYKVVKNISTVHIISAAPLDDQLIGKIKDKIHAEGMIDGEIEIVEEVDPSLIGGFVLEFDGYRYDASISWRLADLQKEAYTKNFYKSKVIAR